MRTTNVSIKFRGQEVRNPVLRFVLGVILAIMWVAAMLLWCVVIITLVVLSPLWLLVHFVLVACGCKGFITRTRDSVNIKFEAASFRKKL